MSFDPARLDREASLEQVGTSNNQDFLLNPEYYASFAEQLFGHVMDSEAGICPIVNYRDSGRTKRVPRECKACKMDKPMCAHYKKYIFEKLEVESIGRVEELLRRWNKT